MNSTPSSPFGSLMGEKMKEIMKFYEMGASMSSGIWGKKFMV